MKSVSKMTFAKQCTGEQNRLFPFLIKSSSQSRSCLFLAFVIMTNHKQNILLTSG